VARIPARFVLAGGLVAGILALRSEAQGPSLFSGSTGPPTQERPGAQYLGSNACAQCHAAQAEGYKGNAMQRAAEATRECRVLTSHPLLTFETGPYRYRIERRGSQSVYQVTDGSRTFSTPIAWCFGLGQAGQTYILERNGAFYESRVSYFTKVDALDFTMGAPSGVPASFEEAIGRPMNDDDVRGCFGCHTTLSAKGHDLQVDKLVPGVTCEGCHGPGGAHLVALGKGDPNARGILNPARLTTEELSNFCGNCHRSWETVMLAGIRGIPNVRFQPYRLTNSKCYDADDARISCIACHNPHAARRSDARFYDDACRACHAAGARKAGARVAKVCPTGREACSDCHMPKYELPGSHFDSTDHKIRIVKAGAPYPD
jgi:hypothetical protein